MDKSSLLDILNSRRTLSERFSKKWKDNVKKWIKDYNIETILESKFEGLDNMMQIPYIFSTIESSLPSMFENIPKLTITQRGKNDREFTNFTNSIWDYLQDKTNLEEVVEEIGFNFLVTGLGIAKYGWTLETEEVIETTDNPILNNDGSQVLDDNGQPVIQTTKSKIKVPVKDYPFVKSFDYKHIEFSVESKFVCDDTENLIPYIFCKTSMTPLQIKEKYNKTVKNISYIDLKDIDNTIVSENNFENESTRSDMERVNVFEYYGVLSKANSMDKNWNVNNVYYVIFVKEMILKNPVKLEKKPFVLAGNYGTTTKFWRFGEPKVLRELEQDISLGRSRIADIRDKQGTKIAIPEGTEVDEEALKRAKDFTIMRFIGNTIPQYITPPPISETILIALQKSQDDLQMASATLDVSRGSDQNTVQTATGQKIFSQATQKRIARKKKKIGNLIKNIAQNLLILCAYNWDIETFSKITDITDTNLLNTYVKQLQQLGEQFDLNIDTESINTNSETESAQAIALYREMKNEPLIKKEEVVRYAILKGFNIIDADRFIKSAEEIAEESSQQIMPRSNVSVSVRADAGTTQGDEILMAEGLIKNLENNIKDPQAAIPVLEYLIKNNIINENEASIIVNKLAQIPNIQSQEEKQLQTQSESNQNQQLEKNTNNKEGRPAKATPTDIVKKSMVGSNNVQVSAQNQAAYKQMFKDKGPQNVR